MIEAKVIEDSISDVGKRITTMQLVYPRFIHSEFMTHRVFSRNASSSRAIPVKKMLEMVRNTPAMPIHWGVNQPGMQANEEMAGDNLQTAKDLWLSAAANASYTAEAMMELGLHKQVANRILEPFQHIHVLVTATEWDNFFELRAHPDAQPEIHELALRIIDTMEESTPRLLAEGEWHLPYVSFDERNDGFFLLEENQHLLRKISAARCCRVSYLKTDGTAPNVDDDLALYKRLAGSVPIHASPLEHQATPDVYRKEAKFGGWDGWEHPELHGNFSGWKQFRRFVQFNVEM